MKSIEQQLVKNEREKIMSYHADGYMERLYAQNKSEFDIGAIEGQCDFEKFSQNMGKAYISCLGEMPKGLPLDVKILSETACDGYTRQKIEYTADDGFRAPAYILVPNGPSAPRPAVIALAGHGYGVADIVGLTENGEEKPEGKDPGYQKNFAVELVKRGFVVAAPELFGFGELMLEPKEGQPAEGSSCYMLTTQLFMYGKTMAGIRVWQAQRMFKYLASLKDADPRRIGSMGISGGGLVSSFFAAYNQSVKACVVSGYFCTFKHSIMGIHHCIDNFVPGFLKYGEMAELFALIAPRPLLMESGTKDTIFPIEAVKSSYARLEALYGRLGARDNIDIDVFEGEHQISGAKAYDFLAERL
ncbi:MAG: alpha/beta hydrolase family protein [Oscillospiraceae bacterium]|nr:alpha/beta hydrolase family protein [Oscillospiraceae bacterium]